MPRNEWFQRFVEPEIYDTEDNVNLQFMQKRLGNCKVSCCYNSLMRTLSAVALVNSEMTLSYHLRVRTLTAHSGSGCAGSKLFVLSTIPPASGFQAEN